MRKKITLSKSFLLFLFLLVSSITAIKAQEEVSIASFTFSDHEGWTVVDDGGTKYFKILSTSDYIQSDAAIIIR